jgi:protein tyrosine/serine phosphatase
MNLTNVNIPNLAMVDDIILRGGQPTGDDWAWLKANGITKIIKLNEESEGDDTPAKALGMELVYEPINLADQLIFKPNLASVKRAVEAIETGVLTHCTHGNDRTGLIIGCYRVWKCGWKKDVAYVEMLQYGFHPELLGLTLFWEWAI